MHCPRCGQKQVSNETRFCSRCGFQLAIVSELLLHNGALPQLAQLDGKRTFVNRKNGLVFSAIWFIFLLLILTPFFGIVGIDELAGMSALLGIFGGLIMAILSLTVLPSSKTARPLPVHEAPTPQPAVLYGHQNAAALPPQQQQPAVDYAAPAGSWRTPDTGELARPGSVIEDTTKLLKRDE